MSEKLQPIIDTWYQSVTGDKFEVIAIDEEEGNVEIQYLDGALAELEIDAWESMLVEEIEAPQDALADLYDDAERADVDYPGPNEIEDGEWPGSYEDIE